MKYHTLGSPAQRATIDLDMKPYNEALGFYNWLWNNDSANGIVQNYEDAIDCLCSSQYDGKTARIPLTSLVLLL